MNKLIIILLLFSPMALASGQFDFGGKIDDGDLSIVTSVDHSWEGKRFTNDIEFETQVNTLLNNATQSS